MKILVTGGAGYIGSHTCVELLNSGYEVVVMDNLYNASAKALDRVQQITGKTLTFYEADMLDQPAMDKIFEAEKPDAVIHFAGYKAVGESVVKPIEYYHNNMTGTLLLCDTMRKHGVKNIIFSSSATVYGDPLEIPITEECPKQSPTNPYGQTKTMLEQVLMDIHRADPEWNVTLLRYFNPIGAHPSALIGELPNGVPNNLIPFLTQTVAGIRPQLSVFGDDYNTPDGSPIRDYIDVVDLAKAHVVAIRRLLDGKNKANYEYFNIGTGNGLSVLGLIKAFEKATGEKVNYKIVGRRAGDIEKVWADTTLANQELGWKAEVPIEETLANAWKWQQALMKK